MNYSVKPYHRYISDEVLLADVRKTAEKLGKKHLRILEYRKEGEFYPSTFYRRFGGWNKALLKAGLEVKSFRRIPVESADIMQ